MPDLLPRAKLKLALAWIVVLQALSPCVAHGQSTKEINQQTQFWGSLNSTSRLTDRFGIVADFHVRRNDFLADPSFYFLRFGSHFWISDRFTITFGYAHMWKAPAQEGWHTWTNEDRIYQQIQYASKIGRATSMLQRFRCEQRWQEQVANDVMTAERSYSTRMRHLLSFTMPVSKNTHIPSLVLSNEILIQFGSGITYNTFDQDRFFVGIKKNLSPSWSFDFGYMPVYQEKSNGFQYDLNHTVRLFFYFMPDFHKKSTEREPASNEE